MKNFVAFLKRNNTSENKILLLIVSIFFTIFTTIALHRYWQYAAWYYDFGIFYTAIASVAQLKAPIIDHFVFTNQNILGDHFHPIIFLLSPFVAIFKRGEVLLVFQSLFISLSGIFIYKISKHLQKNRFQAFAMLLLYFSFIGLHNALITEFHAVALLPLPLSMFLYGMVKRNKLWYFLGLIFVLVTKETTFIIPAWFSLLLIWKGNKQWKKIGLFTLVGSLAYGFIIFKYVFAFFNGEGSYYAQQALDEPQSLIPQFSTLMKKTMFYTLLSKAFLPLLAPETLPPILFNWWTRFTSDATSRHDLGLHYNAEIAPTLILATNIGWIRLKKLVNKILPSFKNYYFKLALFLIVVASAFLNVYILRSPINLFGNPAFYAHTKNFKFLDELVANIPEDGIVMAQTNIAAHIAYRTNVIMLRDSYDIFPHDYIVIDTREGQEANNFLGITFSDLVRRLSEDDSYKIIYQSGEQFIYKKIK